MLKRSFAVVMLFALFAGLAFSPTQAQDDTPTITCDSTLILLLYIAEHDFGFHSMYDTAQFEKGVYAPLFDEMMAMMEDDMGEDDMAEEDMSSEDDMADDMAEEDMMGMMLTPGIVQGEDAACTELRAELESFFYDHFTGDMMEE